MNGSVMILWAAHGGSVEVDDKGGFGKSVPISRGPRLGEDSIPPFEPLVSPSAGKISTVDVELGDSPMCFHVGTKNLGGKMLGLVGRTYGGREDHAAIQIARQVTFVAVEQLALGLSAVAHVGVCDRDTTILRDAAFDPHTAAVRVRLEILSDDTLHESERLLEGGLRDLVG